MRISIFLLCVMLSIPAHAAWTGISAFVTQGDADWQLGGHEFQNDFTQYGLRIEEKTEVNLRIGASIGQFDIKFLDLAGNQPLEQYDGQFVSFYLRWPEQLSDSIRVHSLFNYQFNSGQQRDQSENGISWSEISLELGISLQLGRLSIRPFADYRYIDGDVSGTATATRLLNVEDRYSSGLILDYYIERTAFLRFRLSQGAYQSFQISLAREF